MNPPGPPPPRQPTADYAKLRAPFPPEQIGTLPATQKRPAQKYVSHVYVTDRLNEAAPGWEIRVLERFEAGGDCWVLARMVIDGVSRDEYGDGSDPKSAIGNALRRCAMRWGVALDLWMKEEQASDTGTREHSTRTPPHVAAAAAGGDVPVSEPTSEGGSGVGGTPADSGYGEGPQPDPSPDPLAALLASYGSPGRALLAARKHWPDVPDLITLTPEQVTTLVEEAP